MWGCRWDWSCFGQRPIACSGKRCDQFLNTRWFKYDRDKLCLVYTQIVPVIFEPPCTMSFTPVTYKWNLPRGVSIWVRYKQYFTLPRYADGAGSSETSVTTCRRLNDVTIKQTATKVATHVGLTYIYRSCKIHFSTENVLTSTVSKTARTHRTR